MTDILNDRHFDRPIVFSSQLTYSHLAQFVDVLTNVFLHFVDQMSVGQNIFGQKTWHQTVPSSSVSVPCSNVDSVMPYYVEYTVLTNKKGILKWGHFYSSNNTWATAILPTTKKLLSSTVPLSYEHLYYTIGKMTVS
jgi:hypothetical protein